MNPARNPARFIARILAPVALAAGVAIPAQAADKEFVPGPDTYICPNVTVGGVACFLDAVQHLYTMCRHIKSIEIFEFGYERSEQGVNGAKTAYCLEKHQNSIQRPMQAALREASGNRDAAAAMRELHARWLAALSELKWKPGETDAQYKERVSRPYVEFRRSAEVVTGAVEYAKARSGPKDTTFAATPPAAAGSAMTASSAGSGEGSTPAANASPAEPTTKPTAAGSVSKPTATPASATSGKGSTTAASTSN